jgi:hypothetical protein
MAIMEWRDHTYNDTYDNLLANLAERRRREPAFSLDEARNVLKHLYIQQGNDWLGRGELQETILNAQVAAYEAFVASWEKESPQP